MLDGIDIGMLVAEILSMLNIISPVIVVDLNIRPQSTSISATEILMMLNLLLNGCFDRFLLYT